MSLLKSLRIFRISKLLVLFVVIFLILGALSFAHIQSFNMAVQALSSALVAHRIVVVLWHLILVSLIYWLWGKKISRLAKASKNPEEAQKAHKRLRLIAIGAFVLIDLIFLIH